jgi:alanyl-tRNA synthetase
LFGEKYGDEVRVVSMGKDSGFRIQDSKFVSPESRNPNPDTHSVELCGGTHVRATGDIGLFKIISEAAVAAGIRRIEAVTQAGAFEYLAEQDARMRDMALQLKTSPEALADKVTALINERKKLEKELGEAKKSLAMGGGSGAAVAEPETVGSYKFFSNSFDGLDPKELRSIAEGHLKQADVVVVTTNVEGKASIVVAVSKDKSSALSAVELVKVAVEAVGGKGGGGRPEMAQGGGPDADKLPQAIEAIKAKLA